jgi:hypothetical protein
MAVTTYKIITMNNICVDVSILPKNSIMASKEVYKADRCIAWIVLTSCFLNWNIKGTTNIRTSNITGNILFVSSPKVDKKPIYPSPSENFVKL